VYLLLQGKCKDLSLLPASFAIPQVFRFSDPSHNLQGYFDYEEALACAAKKTSLCWSTLLDIPVPTVKKCMVKYGQIPA